MVKKMFRLFTVLGLLAGPAHAAELFLPSAGEDFFPATELNLELQIGTEKLVAGCSGPTTVNRGDPVDNTIPTEIVEMQLTCSGGITVRVNPDQPSIGQINANGDSFFLMFVEIDVPDLGILKNQEPATMQSTIGHIPPFGSVYFGLRPVPLFFLQDAVATLIHVEHRVNHPPQARNQRRGESCLLLLL